MKLRRIQVVSIGWQLILVQRLSAERTRRPSSMAVSARANLQMRGAQYRVLRTRDLVNEDWFLHLQAALLQKRSGRLLWQSSGRTRTGREISDSPSRRPALYSS